MIETHSIHVGSLQKQELIRGTGEMGYPSDRHPRRVVCIFGTRKWLARPAMIARTTAVEGLDPGRRCAEEIRRTLREDIAQEHPLRQPEEPQCTLSASKSSWTKWKG